jgi:predicted deacylase
MPRFVLSLVLPAILAPALAAQRSPFHVGSVQASPGTRASGYLEIPAAADSATRIPITVIHGSEPGPVLALVAGTHGSEVAPILALQRVRRDVHPTQLRGTLILVHVANLPSYLKRTVYYNPWDGKNLNRVYPGKPDGTVTERIAYAITTEVIERADYLVDMHSGDGNENLRAYNYWNHLGLDPRADSIGREMAQAWGNYGIVVDTERPKDPAASVYTQNTAHLRGKPSITTENGFLGMPDHEMVQANYDGAFRLMRYLGMLDGPVVLNDRPVWFVRTQVMTSPATGVWHPRVDVGQYVVEGTVLGVVTDYFGDPIAEVRAPFAGVAMYIVDTPAMSEGEPVSMVAVPAADWH